MGTYKDYRLYGDVTDLKGNLRRQNDRTEKNADYHHMHYFSTMDSVKGFTKNVL